MKMYTCTQCGSWWTRVTSEDVKPPDQCPAECGSVTFESRDIVKTMSASAVIGQHVGVIEFGPIEPQQEREQRVQALQAKLDSLQRTDDMPRIVELEAKIAELEKPIPMIVFCPACHHRHIDEGDFATKPHRNHACQGCGVVFRLCAVDTVGVAFLPNYEDEGTPVATITRDRSLDGETNIDLDKLTEWAAGQPDIDVRNVVSTLMTEITGLCGEIAVLRKLTPQAAPERPWGKPRGHRRPHGKETP